MSNDTDDILVRLRRCKSVTRAEDIQKVEAEIRKIQPDKPCVFSNLLIYVLQLIKLNHINL